MFSMGAHGIYFSLVSLLYFHQQIQHLQYFIHLDLAPYIPSSRLHMKSVYVTVCMRPDAMDVTY